MVEDKYRDLDVDGFDVPVDEFREEDIEVARKKFQWYRDRVAKKVLDPGLA